MKLTRTENKQIKDIDVSDSDPHNTFGDQREWKRLYMGVYFLNECWSDSDAIEEDPVINSGG